MTLLLILARGLFTVLTVWVLAPHLARRLRRLVCRLRGHDAVTLGLSDTPEGIVMWRACRRCSWADCAPFMPAPWTLAEWHAALERARRVPPAVTRVRTRKPLPTKLPSDGRRVTW